MTNQPSLDARLAVLEAELPSGFQRIEDHFEETKRELSEIKKETKATNGRVTSLELSEAQRIGANKTWALVLGLPAVALSTIGLVASVHALFM
jgi:hypothetical protein